MKKKMLNYIYKSLAVVMLLGMVTATALFFIGFHNVDLGQNGMRMELIFNTSLSDYNGYNEIGMTDMYINGLHQMIIAFFIMTFSALNFPIYKRYL